MFSLRVGCVCVSLLALVEKLLSLIFGSVPLNLDSRERIWSSFLTLFLLELQSYFWEMFAKSSVVPDLISWRVWENFKAALTSPSWWLWAGFFWVLLLAFTFWLLYYVWQTYFVSFCWLLIMEDSKSHECSCRGLALSQSRLSISLNLERLDWHVVRMFFLK